jgi:two-component system CheB/CheR fusion protein
MVGDKAGGLGIGLSVVKDLTKLHAGSVQVRSDGIGKGSEFVVRLPLAGPDKGRPDSPA